MSLPHLTIRGRMLLLTGLCAATVVAIGVVVDWSGKRLSEQTVKVSQVYLPAVQLAGLTDMMHDALRSTVYRAAYGLEKNANKAYYQEVSIEYEEYAKNIGDYIQSLRELSIPKEVFAELASIDKPLREYVESGRAVLDLCMQGRGQDVPAAIMSFNERFEVLETALGGFGTKVQESSKTFSERSHVIIKETEQINIALIVIGVSSILLISWYLARRMVMTLTAITQELRTQAEKVTGSAVQMNTSSQKLAEAATQQSSAIEETVASMEEIGSMITQTSQHAQQMVKEADEGTRKAQDGKQVVERMVHSMTDIALANERLQTILRVIEDIRSKTRVINDIAFETRLLSFNASIEAARAGANGRGFAVVAEEVGKLAVVSGRAADEIRTLLESSMQSVQDIVLETKSRTDAGLQTSHECEHAFSVMESLLQNLNRTSDSVALANREQEGGVKQTNRAMVEMEKATQSTFKGAEGLMVVSRSLASTSQEMLVSSERLNRLVLGTRQVQESGKNPPSPPSAVPPVLTDMKSPPGERLVDDVERNDSRWTAAS
jgi:methyl-accepting chemotaxis protein